MPIALFFLLFKKFNIKYLKYASALRKSEAKGLQVQAHPVQYNNLK